MARRIIDLSLDIEDNMPSTNCFQSPVYLQAMTHENTKALELGTPDDPITFQTNFISTLDHVGYPCGCLAPFRPQRRVDRRNAHRSVLRQGGLFRPAPHPDLGDIDVADMEKAEEESGVKVDGHIILLCSGLHKRHYPNREVVLSNPGITVAATQWMYDRGSRLHGVEGPSTDKPSDSLFAQHRICRELGISHMEWLVNLEELIGLGEFEFFGVPLRFKGGSGSPIRAFAIVDD